MTLTDMVNEFQVVYNAHFGPEVQPLLVQPPGHQEGFLPETSDARQALCAKLEAAGLLIDHTTMGWGWAALNAMSDRSNFGVGSAYGYPTVPVDFSDWTGTMAALRKLYPPIAPPPPEHPVNGRSPVGDVTGADPVDGKYSYFANIPESLAFKSGDPYQGFVYRETRTLMGWTRRWFK